MNQVEHIPNDSVAVAEPVLALQHCPATVPQQAALRFEGLLFAQSRQVLFIPVDLVLPQFRSIKYS